MTLKVIILSEAKNLPSLTAGRDGSFAKRACGLRMTTNDQRSDALVVRPFIIGMSVPVTRTVRRTSHRVQ